MIAGLDFDLFIVQARSSHLFMVLCLCTYFLQVVSSGAYVHIFNESKEAYDTYV